MLLGEYSLPSTAGPSSMPRERERERERERLALLHLDPDLISKPIS